MVYTVVNVMRFTFGSVTFNMHILGSELHVSPHFKIQKTKARLYCQGFHTTTRPARCIAQSQISLYIKEGITFITNIRHGIHPNFRIKFSSIQFVCAVICRCSSSHMYGCHFELKYKCWLRKLETLNMVQKRV